MIVVTGFNTAIDVQVDVAALQPGRTHSLPAAAARAGRRGLASRTRLLALPRFFFETDRGMS
jgi:hypothetical protein